MNSGEFDTALYRQHSNIVARKVAGEFLLIPLKQGMVDAQRVFTLNEVGQRVWDLLKAGQTVRSVAQNITTEFDVEINEALDDVRGLITLLVARDLLVAVPA